jgi:hypothetical protein
MGTARRGAHRGSTRWVFAIVFGLAVLCGPVPSASAKHPKLPAVPRCGAFSAKKVIDVLRVGRRMYLQHVLLGTSCEYYGLTIKQANKFAETFVPYDDIVYYPSLMISAVETDKELFEKQLVLLEKQHYTEYPVYEGDPLRIAKHIHGSDEVYFHGAETGQKLPDCDPTRMYDNWLGPPSCKQQPDLEHAQVLAWIPRGGGGFGVMIFVSASNAEGAPLSIDDVIKLAKETTTGALY